MPEVVGSSTVDDTRDLVSRAEIHDLVVEFYREVVFDDLLAPALRRGCRGRLAAAHPQADRLLVSDPAAEGSYAGAVTAAHRHLHGLEPVRAEHCDRWYVLWANSVDARWAGPTADRAKSHAASLMAGMAKHIFGFEWAPPAG